MRRDYKVTLRTEESIAYEALRWRTVAGVDLDDAVDIVAFVQRLCRTELPGKGRPTLNLFEGEQGATPAFVTYRPLTLAVERETWDFARLGDPDSLYILAHEIGHIVLHDLHPKAFAVGPVDTSLYGLDDWSAEWQANTFADYFLLPDHILRRRVSVEDAMVACGVSRQLAARRWRRSVAKMRRRQSEVEGTGR